MIALIDDGDAHIGAGQAVRDGQAAEPSADDDDVVPARVAHGGVPLFEAGASIVATAYPAAIHASSPPCKGRTFAKP